MYLTHNCPRLLSMIVGPARAIWVTTQIGGDAVYRGAGIVVSHGEVVGKSNDSGEVTAKLITSREGGCRGATVENERAQALWSC